MPKGLANMRHTGKEEVVESLQKLKIKGILPVLHRQKALTTAYEICVSLLGSFQCRIQPPFVSCDLLASGVVVLSPVRQFVVFDKHVYGLDTQLVVDDAGDHVCQFVVDVARCPAEALHLDHCDPEFVLAPEIEIALILKKEHQYALAFPGNKLDRLPELPDDIGFLFLRYFHVRFSGDIRHSDSSRKEVDFLGAKQVPDSKTIIYYSMYRCKQKKNTALSIKT